MCGRPVAFRAATSIINKPGEAKPRQAIFLEQFAGKAKPFRISGGKAASIMESVLFGVRVACLREAAVSLVHSRDRAEYSYDPRPNAEA